MLEDFKKFILRGNVVDMAVGVIIGGAFGKIVTSLVNDVVMPFVGVALGKVNFTELKKILVPEVKNEAGEIVTAEVAIKYGQFIQNIIDFLLIAICIFIMIKIISKLHKKKEEEPAPAGPTTEELLTDIRDILKKNAKKETSTTTATTKAKAKK